MITLNYAGTKYDKDVVWVYKWTIDGTINYLSDRTISLTNSYDGEVLSYNAGEINKEIDISDGGGVGNVGSYEFSFVDKVSNSNFNSFFNEFYPTTAKYLTNTKIQIGITWSGASLDSEINWLYTFYVENMDWVDTDYTVTCIEFDEYVTKELPPYEIQTSYDNGISYFPSVPKENRNTSLPIIYGYFPSGLNNLIEYDHVFSPIILVNELEAQYAIACHKLNALTTGSIYSRIDTLDNYVKITGDNESVINTYSASAKIADSAGILEGLIYVHPTTNTGDLYFLAPNASPASYNFTMTEADSNILDRDTTTGFTLTAGQKAGLTFNYRDIETNILQQTLEGSYSGGTNIKVIINCKSSSTSTSYRIYIVKLDHTGSHRALPLDGSDRDDSVYYYPYTATGTQGENATQSIVFQDTSIGELLNTAIVIHNNDGSNSLIVYEAYYEFNGFRVSGVKRDKKKTLIVRREPNQGELDYVAGRWRERGY